MVDTTEKEIAINVFRKWRSKFPDEYTPIIDDHEDIIVAVFDAWRKAFSEEYSSFILSDREGDLRIQVDGEWVLASVQFLARTMLTLRLFTVPAVEMRDVVRLRDVVDSTLEEAFCGRINVEVDSDDLAYLVVAWTMPAAHLTARTIRAAAEYFAEHVRTVRGAVLEEFGGRAPDLGIGGFQ